MLSTSNPVLSNVTVSPPSAVAPGSVYGFPWAISNGLAPTNVITGPVVSLTITLLYVLLSFPLASVAL